MKPVIRVTCHLCEGQDVIKYRHHTHYQVVVLKHQFFLNKHTIPKQQSGGRACRMTPMQAYASTITSLFSHMALTALHKTRSFPNQGLTKASLLGILQLSEDLPSTLLPPGPGNQSVVAEASSEPTEPSSRRHLNSYNSTQEFYYTLTFENE